MNKRGPLQQYCYRRDCTGMCGAGCRGREEAFEQDKQAEEAIRHLAEKIADVLRGGRKIP